MRCDIKRIISLTFLVMFVTHSGVFAMTVESTGSAPIISYDLRAAHKNAINSGLLSAIRYYYSTNSSGSSPDVSYDFIKFVNRYSIKSSNVEENIITVSLSVEIDDVGLKDVSTLSTSSKNTAVFSYSGIDNKLITHERVSALINSQLEKEAFLTSEQKAFDYYAMNDSGADLIQSFADLSSKYYFDFKITTSFINLTKPDSKCELTINTSINVRAGLGSQLQITAASTSGNKKMCVEEALLTGVMNTLSYIRGNIILKKDANNINTINIRAKNFGSMVDVNNILNQLKNRGYIATFKTLSFAPKDVLFSVESILDINTLNDRVKLTDPTATIQSNINSGEIVLDFQR